jgi:hypothetical protein
MIGKGPGDVKRELVANDPIANLLIFKSKTCGLAHIHHTS